jgi:hypothetical protein
MYWGSSLSTRLVFFASYFQGADRRRRFREEWLAELAAVQTEFQVPGVLWACLTVVGSVRVSARRGAVGFVERRLRPYRHPFTKIRFPANQPIRMVRYRAKCGMEEMIPEYVVYGRGATATEVLEALTFAPFVDRVVEDIVSVHPGDEVAQGFASFLQIRGGISPVRRVNDSGQTVESGRLTPMERALVALFVTVVLLGTAIVAAFRLPGAVFKRISFFFWWMSTKPDHGSRHRPPK